MHLVRTSREVDHTNMKMSIEKSIEGICCNSQSFNTIPCLASIIEKKGGNKKRIAANRSTPIITFTS